MRTTMDPVSITQKFINSAKGAVNKLVPKYPDQNISETALEFVQRISNSTTKVITEFLEKKTKPVQIRSEDAKLYRYNNLLLYRSNGEKAFNLEQNLKDFEHSGITPRFVKYFSLGQDDFLTIMDVNEKALVPYYKVADKIKPEVKQAFKNNVKKLLNGKILNRELFANKDALFVTSDGKRILFGDWADVSYHLQHGEIKNVNEMFKNWRI